MPAFSRRQKEYARVFNLHGVYTPQLVINGKKEMVGSDANKIAITLKQQVIEPDVRLQLNEVIIADNTVVITYTLAGHINNTVLNIALIQNKISTYIKAGENNGINLINYNVVRNFKSFPSTNKTINTCSIALNQLAGTKGLSLVAFLQDSTTYNILAAAKWAL